MFSLNQPHLTTLALAITLSLATLPTAFAEDTPADTCASAASLFKEGDIEGALEEARWCVTQLEQLKQSRVSSFFKDEINGFKGGKLNKQQAMGISMIERSYSKDGKIIKVSLSGGASGVANNAFAALASFGMQAADGEKIRIQRRTAVVTADGNNNQVVVTLKNDGMLTFESNDLSSKDVTAFAKAFPIADLDDSRN
ncbi:hypothetical protein NBRC116592_13130 [Colwellia sp. KU-HH00111]|uniref:hypothetical protein n=1 Tax=Colwellia sp. KU-HH00111 TaxID=3127652 RepID=UPI00310B0A7C